MVKPFAGMGTRAFLAIAQGFEKELGTAIPALDKATKRAVAVKSALMGFTELIHLAGTVEDDVQDFMPSPALRSAFMTLVGRADALQKMRSKRQAVVLAAVPDGNQVAISAMTSALRSSAQWTPPASMASSGVGVRPLKGPRS